MSQVPDLHDGHLNSSFTGSWGGLSEGLNSAHLALLGP